MMPSKRGGNQAGRSAPLVARCPKGRMMLAPPTLAVIQQWLTLMGQRHLRAADAAHAALIAGGSSVQRAVEAGEMRRAGMIAYLASIADQKWSAADWHTAGTAVEVWVQAQQEVHGGSASEHR